MNDTLRNQLIRIANNSPEYKEVVTPFINGDIEIESIEDIQPERYLHAMFGGEAGDKVAYNEDTKRFVAWCVDQNNKYSESKTRAEVERLSGKAPLEPKPKGKDSAPTRNTGNLKRGEVIKLDKYKCTIPANQPFCDKYNNADREDYGVVTRIESDGVLIQMHDKKDRKLGSPILLEGLRTGRGTGMYRHTLMARIGSQSEVAPSRSGTILEVVYISGGKKPPSMSDQQAFAQYINRGVAKGEEREAIYYTGRLTRFAISKTKNQLYFQIQPDQRNRPVNINPQVGTLLYVGLEGRRPGGWKSSLRDEVKVLLSSDPEDLDGEKEDS